MKEELDAILDSFRKAEFDELQDVDSRFIEDGIRINNIVDATIVKKSNKIRKNAKIAMGVTVALLLGSFASKEYAKHFDAPLAKEYRLHRTVAQSYADSVNLMDQNIQYLQSTQKKIHNPPASSDMFIADLKEKKNEYVQRKEKSESQAKALENQGIVKKINGYEGVSHALLSIGFFALFGSLFLAKNSSEDIVRYNGKYTKVVADYNSLLWEINLEKRKLFEN
ncbi:MAG: hypothetical protein KC535_05585 [Nanoarchaeota archaeon]|nr:hypothetical protein [Nanoarchaeota archaeon]